MLRRRMVVSGNFLFRWRSYLLLIFAPGFLWAVWQGESIETAWGPGAGWLVDAAGIVLVVLGEAIRILTVGFVPRGTSGRNTDKGQIAERLNTSGLYSLTRNPLYLGNCMMYVGLAVYTQHLWLAAVLALVLALYYERIIAAEEDFLQGRFGAPYVAWAAETPPFWPRLHGWRRPDMAFSLRSVIRREHASILGGVIGLYLLELGLHTLPGATAPISPVWHRVVVAAVVIDIVVVVVKKFSDLLAVEGR